MVRQMSNADIPAVVALQVACFPAPFPTELLWTAEHLKRHLEIFPEGQFVALSGGQVIASASTALISETAWQANLPWECALGGHFFCHHDPAGSTLYGADISVDPQHRGIGLGRTLYEARFELVRRRALARFGTGCRLPDFMAWTRAQPAMPRSELLTRYVAEVAAGNVSDRTLSPLLRMGLRVAGTKTDYMDDAESLNCAALLEWTS